MTKYIDVERLKAEIERMREINRKALEAGHIEAGVFHGRAQTLNYLFEFIDSPRQEQPESSKVKFVFPNFLYARTVDNKTIDVSYAPQSMEAVEYIKNDPTEQPEVDLEEEMDRYFDTMQVFEHENIFEETFHKIARHFFKRGEEEMRRRITNPEYNAKVVEQLKSEYPTTKEKKK